MLIPRILYAKGIIQMTDTFTYVTERRTSEETKPKGKEDTGNVNKALSGSGNPKKQELEDEPSSSRLITTRREKGPTDQELSQQVYSLYHV
jgi:hypothetical protein